MLDNTKELASLFGVVAALTMGVVSPGPSFVMVARTAVASSRSQGLAAALGMGAGGALFATAALLGLKGVLLAVPSVYVTLKVAGGLYLAYLGIRIWRAAREPLRIDAATGVAGSSRLGGFLRGLTTQLSNPKTAIVYASVFAAFLPPAPSLGFDVALVINGLRGRVGLVRRGGPGPVVGAPARRLPSLQGLDRSHGWCGDGGTRLEARFVGARLTLRRKQA